MLKFIANMVNVDASFLKFVDDKCNQLITDTRNWELGFFLTSIHIPTSNTTTNKYICIFLFYSSLLDLTVKTKTELDLEQRNICSSSIRDSRKPSYNCITCHVLKLPVNMQITQFPILLHR